MLQVKGITVQSGLVFEWWSENYTELAGLWPKCPVFKWQGPPFQKQTKKCRKINFFGFLMSGIRIISFEKIGFFKVLASRISRVI